MREGGLGWALPPRCSIYLSETHSYPSLSSLLTPWFAFVFGRSMDAAINFLTWSAVPAKRASYLLYYKAEEHRKTRNVIAVQGRRRPASTTAHRNQFQLRVSAYLASLIARALVLEWTTCRNYIYCSFPSKITHVTSKYSARLGLLLCVYCY